MIGLIHREHTHGIKEYYYDGISLFGGFLRICAMAGFSIRGEAEILLQQSFDIETNNPNVINGNVENKGLLFLRDAVLRYPVL